MAAVSRQSFSAENVFADFEETIPTSIRALQRTSSFSDDDSPRPPLLDITRLFLFNILDAPVKDESSSTNPTTSDSSFCRTGKRRATAHHRRANPLRRMAKKSNLLTGFR
ncbi:hypothetical protein O6H91_23G008200 [Diphasiastrum complanatum]|uniref:Uncharacterized protein n=2 Tax=Diphasiastrum complanatum TaxID=34168 RepID=A0ACC2A9N8_DIPCM|nr:hypothetical protein O6H91_23G007000 [Diphasiastrum complanatum]KAJ7513639.1 hypothetical protein O6H91_23G008200 [Diphasiastrum complanatum]